MKITSVDNSQAVKVLGELAMRAETTGLGSEPRNGGDNWVVKADNGSPLALLCCEEADAPTESSLFIQFVFVAPSVNASPECFTESSNPEVAGLLVAVELLREAIGELKVKFKLGD